MDTVYAREQKKELVDILLDSVYYLDLVLVERRQLLHLLMESFYADSLKKAA